MLAYRMAGERARARERHRAGRGPLRDGAHREEPPAPHGRAFATQRDAPPPIPGSTIADLERYAILKTLEACGGSTSKAATVLGVSPRKIQYKLHEYAGASSGAVAPAAEGSDDLVGDGDS